jgi:thiol-disulfide isomerase/thioredoxin
MKRLLIAAIFVAALLALPSAAQPVFPLHDKSRPVPSVTFQDGDGTERMPGDFAGKVVLLNIWATWCTPCRAEMPTLDRLQAQLGGPEFAVVALSIDRGAKRAVETFYMETNVQHLDIYLDPSSKAARGLGALGLPTTLLIDRDGRELGRYVGPAEWDSPTMVAFLQREIARRSDAAAPNADELDRNQPWWRRAVDFVRGLAGWRESLSHNLQPTENQT